MSPRYPGGPRPGVRMPQQVDFNVSTRLIYELRTATATYDEDLTEA